MVTLDDKFIEYVQKHPTQYAIAKSKLCINLLERLSKRGATIKELLAEDAFHNIEEADLKKLMDILVSIKLLDKVTVGTKTIYYSGKFTDQFLENYYSTKKKYDIQIE